MIKNYFSPNLWGKREQKMRETEFNTQQQIKKLQALFMMDEKYKN